MKTKTMMSFLLKGFIQTCQMVLVTVCFACMLAIFFFGPAYFVDKYSDWFVLLYLLEFSIVFGIYEYLHEV